MREPISYGCRRMLTAFFLLLTVLAVTAVMKCGAVPVMAGSISEPVYTINGKPYTGLRKIKNKTYYFKDGLKQTGFQGVAAKNGRTRICYFNKKGRMVTGTRRIRGAKYKFHTVTGAQIYPKPDFANKMKVSQKASQIIVVSVGSSGTTLSMHKKNSRGIWKKILSTRAAVGREGIGKADEYHARTPVGNMTFTKALGIKPDPGCHLNYLQVDDSHYWVGDPYSKYYNQLVSTRTVTDFDPSYGEHIIRYGSVYNYILALSWNKKGTPHKGSAFFLHCTNNYAPTAGCVAVSESAMLKIMKNVQKGCRIIIDYKQNILNY